MTDLDALREAAAKIRETAGKATPGPWGAGYRCVFPPAHIETPDAIVTDGVHGEAGVTVPDDAEWIALMGPDVGEALAAWLEEEARSVEFRDGERPDLLSPTAVALARKILGGNDG